MVDDEFGFKGYATCAGGVVLVGGLWRGGGGAASSFVAASESASLGAGAGGKSRVIYSVLRKWWCHVLRWGFYGA